MSYAHLCWALAVEKARDARAFWAAHHACVLGDGALAQTPPSPSDFTLRASHPQSYRPPSPHPSGTLCAQVFRRWVYEREALRAGAVKRASQTHLGAPPSQLRQLRETGTWEGPGFVPGCFMRPMRPPGAAHDHGAEVEFCGVWATGRSWGSDLVPPSPVLTGHVSSLPPY
jgi:hypothetical protein